MTVLIDALGSVNKSPVVVNDFYTTLEGTTLIIAGPNGILRNDNDPNGDPLTVESWANP